MVVVVRIVLMMMVVFLSLIVLEGRGVEDSRLGLDV